MQKGIITSSFSRMNRLLHVMLSGGHADMIDIRLRGKIIMFNIVALLGVAILTPLGISRIVQGSITLGCIDLLAAIFLTSLSIYRWMVRRVVIPRVVSIVVMSILFGYLTISTGYHNTGLLWSYLLPPMMIFMLDRKRGSLLLLMYVLSVIFGFMVPSFPAYKNYCIALKIAFLLSFIVVWVIAYFFEYIMSSLQDDAIQSNIKIKKLNEDLKQLAECDGLTGTYNRRFFNEYFEIEVKRAKSFIEHKAHLEPSQRNDMNFGLAILDIDHFKLINDTYGHLVGDSVLKQITDIMKENMFSRDVLCRYGGDEFVMILTKTSPDGILQAAEKIRKEIDEHAFIFDEHSRCQHVTISVGLIIFNEVLDKKSGDILKLADDRLLIAKSRGKNRVVYSDGG